MRHEVMTSPDPKGAKWDALRWRVPGRDIHDERNAIIRPVVTGAESEIPQGGFDGIPHAGLFPLGNTKIPLFRSVLDQHQPVCSPANGGVSCMATMPVSKPSSGSSGADLAPRLVEIRNFPAWKIAALELENRPRSDVDVVFAPPGNQCITLLARS